MAVGDDALAAGIELTPGTAPASDIDLWINKLADEVARRTMATLTVARGGTGATNAASARSNLGFPALGAPDQAAPGQLPVYNGNGQLTTVDPTAGGHAASKQYVDAASGPAQSRADDAWNRANNAQGRADEANANGVAARQGNLYADSYNRQLGGTRRTAWLQDNGQLGYAASSERYKKFIRPEDVTDEQVLMLSLVSYQWKAAVAVDDRREMGLIAERVEEAGLGWAAFYNEDGTVEGLNYEMVALAMLPAVQRLIGRTHRIEDRLEALESPGA